MGIHMNVNTIPKNATHYSYELDLFFDLQRKKVLRVFSQEELEGRQIFGDIQREGEMFISQSELTVGYLVSDLRNLDDIEINESKTV